jgi:hypothetical protein
MDRNISDILTLQDVQMANAIRDLKGDPAKLTQFISSRKADLYDKVTKEHSDNFEKVHGDMIRAGDTIKNISYYYVRNKDLDNAQLSLFDSAKTEAEAAMYDSQIAKRQFEINEWTAGNKMDTLFVMQLTFIALMIVAPLLYMTRLGYIPVTVFSMISFLLLVALVLTFVVRYQYTSKSRDFRFWNQRRFPGMGRPPPAPTCPGLDGASSDLLKRGGDLASSLGAQYEQGMEQLRARTGNFADDSQKAFGNVRNNLATLSNRLTGTVNAPA